MQRLIELDAERIVLEEAARVVELLGWTDDVQLYLTVATPGMWTDPVATTVGHALSNHHPGEVLLWFEDEYDRAAVLAAAAIQTMRCCWWTAVGATAPSLRATAWREGIAAATAGFAGESSQMACAALEILGDDATPATAAAFLFGDAAARTLGYIPLGLTGTEGLRHAIHEAHRCLATTELGDVFLETVQPASN